ncbi:MAG: 1-(5-phosphoribosyl)-5-((5-phosphoribosylamino)methylideneamino)imidazole-4-carboxamide isomerase [Proteobacteria bacterium ST_bin11]|nr:MAG: 1-(5-phosphoribosyl)-5-((5-phosphoribosylamino)methylideneamino)imidazole-4-carboxamide isomerase [Proteobacteria bacterium ST_bin11]
MTPTQRIPTEIKLHKVSAILEIHFDDESIYELPSEYLRVFTQSAEAVGHGPGQETLQIGKEDVTITDIQPVGNYAIKLVFSDGHDTGIYSWDLLYKLGSDFPLLWSNYLEELKAAGLSRRSPIHN